MSRLTFHVTDQNGRKVGALFLDESLSREPASTFESIAPTFETVVDPAPQTIERQSFWQSDGIRFGLAGLFTGLIILAYSWWSGSDLGALAAIAAIASGLGLHLLKILRLNPRAQPVEAKPAETVIKIEAISDDRKRMQIDYIEDETITPEEMRRIATAWSEGVSFARSPMVKAAKISNDKYRKVLAEFQRLNLIHTRDNNRNELSLRGKSVLRRLAQ